MNISQSRFTESDIPYHDFEKLGFSRADIFVKMSREDLERLLSGKRTSLHNIKGIDSKGKNFEITTKFSLFRNDNGVTILHLHPVRPEIKNDAGLSDKDIKRLQKGELVSKSINGERYLIQLDEETNEVLKTKTKNIVIPSHIRDVELSYVQKEQLRKGKAITVNTGKEKIQVVIDLDNLRGLNLKLK